MSRFEDYADLAAHCVENAGRAADARYRSLLIDMAATWCEFAQEYVEAADSRKRLEELTRAISELAMSVPNLGPQIEAPVERHLN
jgi:hypothetical protein